MIHESCTVKLWRMVLIPALHAIPLSHFEASASEWLRRLSCSGEPCPAGVIIVGHLRQPPTYQSDRVKTMIAATTTPICAMVTTHPGGSRGTHGPLRCRECFPTYRANSNRGKECVWGQSPRSGSGGGGDRRDWAKIRHKRQIPGPR